MDNKLRNRSLAGMLGMVRKEDEAVRCPRDKGPECCVVLRLLDLKVQSTLVICMRTF